MRARWRYLRPAPSWYSFRAVPWNARALLTTDLSCFRFPERGRLRSSAPVERVAAAIANTVASDTVKAAMSARAEAKTPARSGSEHRAQCPGDGLASPG